MRLYKPIYTTQLPGQPGGWESLGVMAWDYIMLNTDTLFFLSLYLYMYVYIYIDKGKGCILMLGHVGSLNYDISLRIKCGSIKNNFPTIQVW